MNTEQFAKMVFTELQTMSSSGEKVPQSALDLCSDLDEMEGYAASMEVRACAELLASLGQIGAI